MIISAIHLVWHVILQAIFSIFNDFLMPIDQIGPHSGNKQGPSSGMWPVVHKYGRMVFPHHHIPPTQPETKLLWGQVDSSQSDYLGASYIKGMVWVVQPTDKTICLDETTLLHVVGVALLFFY